MPQEITVKQLLEAGVHFGHHTNRWNPKMARFIYTDRNKVYIIDLEKTLAHLKTAAEFLAGIAEKRGTILLVGTKRQAQEAIFEMAGRTEMPYVNQRWLGGMLTNFETVRKSVARLEQIEKMEAEGTYQFLTKKEVMALKTQREKLLKVLSGVRHMKRLPDTVFVVDPKQEEIAVREACRLNIPVVAVIDTNCDPDVIDYPIPGNDDAIRSVKLICDYLGLAVEEARNRYKQIQEAEEVKAREEAECREQVEGEPITEEPEIEEIAEALEEKKIGTKVKDDLAKPKVKRGRPRKAAKDQV